MGIRKSFKFIAEIEDKFFNESKISESVFEAFIEKLIFDNIFTLENIKKIQEIESKRRPGFKPSNGFGHRRGPSGLGFLDSTDKKSKYTDDSKLGSLSPQSKIKSNEEKYGTLIDSMNAANSKNLFENAVSYKNSLEQSELAVSSYDVSNSYFNDRDDGFEEGRNLRTTSEDQPMGMIITDFKAENDEYPRERNLSELAHELGFDEDESKEAGSLEDIHAKASARRDTTNATMTQSSNIHKKKKQNTRSFGVNMGDDDDDNDSI